MSDRLPVSWGLVEQVKRETWKMLAKAKFIPNAIICQRSKDFVAAGWLAASAPSIRIGSVEAVDKLVTGRCKLILLSADNDDNLTELVRRLHTTLSTLPFLYQVKTVTLFDRGYPVYDFSGYQLPYQPIFPWEKIDGGGSTDTPKAPDAHILPPSSFYENQNPKED